MKNLILLEIKPHHSVHGLVTIPTDGTITAIANKRLCSMENTEYFTWQHDILLLLLLEALQLQRSFGLLNEFPPFGPVSDAVLPVCYFHPCYIAIYIILPSIFRSS